MSLRAASFVLFAAVLGAAAFAALSKPAIESSLSGATANGVVVVTGAPSLTGEPGAAEPSEPEPFDPSPFDQDPSEPGNPGPLDESQTTLPPNHPPIGDSPGQAPLGAQTSAALPANHDSAAITWKMPATWESAPNPSAMRIATYRVTGKAGTDPAEVSVMRAGGTTEANLERWRGQFDDRVDEKRTVKKVRGLTVTIIEVGGTFVGGGMMPGASDAPRQGWALVGAIVETPDSPYFFKMTGNAKTVTAARAAFEALIESITPT